MERVEEFIGKDVQKAVEEGLKTLGITLDDADIKIIQSGGLFKKAKVEIRYDDGLKEGEVPKKEEAKAEPAKEPKKDEPAPVKRESKPKKEHKEPKEHSKEPSEEAEAPKQKKQREATLPTEEQIETARTFLTELLAHMKIEGKVEITVDDGMRVNLETEDSRVIGHRGEVLDAMQQLISAVINTAHGKYVHATVDGLGYRDRRKETLENLARRMADKAVRTHRKVTLEAMSSSDRRIVHAALGDREDVFTRSEGHEPARRVAILPKRNNK